MSQILVTTMANSVFRAKILNPYRLKSLKPTFSHYSLTKRRNPYIFTDFTFVRCTNAPKGFDIISNWRHLSDKFTEKGRGDEKNYFLRISREQFVKLKERRVKEIVDDIRALEATVKGMDRNTSLQAEKVRQNLMVEIKELKALLEKFKQQL